MKTFHTRNIFFLPLYLLAGFAILLFEGCSKSDPAPATQTEAQKVTAQLKSATWKIQSVTVDGADQSGLFKNLAIKFTDKNFTTSNGGPVWPANGTWAFANDQATSFTRDDGVLVTIQTISSTTLVLGLTWTKTTLGPGRLESLKGQTVFTFGP